MYQDNEFKNQKQTMGRKDILLNLTAKDLCSILQEDDFVDNG